MSALDLMVQAIESYAAEMHGLRVRSDSASGSGQRSGSASASVLLYLRLDVRFNAYVGICIKGM
jgi:hypothetical protein